MISPPFGEEITVIVAAEQPTDIGHATDLVCGQLPTAKTRWS
jgi:hypothetical protein